MNLNFIKPLFSAIRFITILPIGKSVAFDPKGMIPFFPFVGLMIGILLCLFDRMISLLWSNPTVAVLDVVFLAAITGAFHLDGLGDAADGIFSHRSREKALLIMKDSRVGIMGLITIVLVLAIKWAGIMELETHRTMTLIIIPAYARASMVFGIKFLNYGRPEGGTGYVFFKDHLSVKAFSGLIVMVILSLFLGWDGILLNITFIALITAILILYKKRMGYITGDMLGAMCELSESIMFLMVTTGSG